MSSIKASSDISLFSSSSFAISNGNSLSNSSAVGMMFSNFWVSTVSWSSSFKSEIFSSMYVFKLSSSSTSFFSDFGGIFLKPVFGFLFSSSIGVIG